MRLSAAILALTGGFLLLLNLYGVTQSLRPSGLSSAATYFEDDLLHSAKTFRQLASEPLPEGPEAVTYLTRLVADSLAHFWDADLARAYHIHLPPWENYLLWALGYIREDYRLYEFCRADKAVERGLGLCSQHAIVLWVLLDDLGIPCRIVSLDGHVVVTAQVERNPSRWWILDPDFRVVVPLSLEDIEADPEQVRPYYRHPGRDLEALVRAYGPEGNRLHRSVGDYCGRKVYYETASYVLVWLIPVVLLGLAGGLWRRGRTGRSTAGGPEHNELDTR